MAWRKRLMPKRKKETTILDFPKTKCLGTISENIDRRKQTTFRSQMPLLGGRTGLLMGCSILKVLSEHLLTGVHRGLTPQPQATFEFKHGDSQESLRDETKIQVQVMWG